MLGFKEAMRALDYSSEAEVLLIQPEYGKQVRQRIFQPGLEFPYNLTCLSSYLEREGITNEIFDWRLYHKADEIFPELLRKLKPLVVGITSVTSGINNAAEIAKITKETNRIIVTVVGGCHASALPEETLIYHPYFDYLVHGEGEIALTNLIRAVEDGGKNIAAVRGIAYRKDSKVIVNSREELITNLDSLPFPARHKIELDKYAPNPATRNYMRLPSTGLSVGRGCPYNCLFCYKGVWGKSVRLRSVDNVIREIKGCIERYGIRDFRFYDDVLTFPKWDIKGFCKKIIQNNIDISWSCWSRVNDVSYDTLVLMKKAGCYHIKYGIEFGTDKALKLSKKGITLEQSRKAIKDTQQVGIECKGSFIFGIPGETIKDCRKTIEFALDLSPNFATFYAYDCVPGSGFYEQRKKGLCRGPILPQETTQKLVHEAYKRFYFRLTFMLQRAKSIFRNPEREIKAIRSGLRMMFIYFLSRRVCRKAQDYQSQVAVRHPAKKELQ